MSRQLQKCPATLARLLEKPEVPSPSHMGVGQGFALSHPSISYSLVSTTWLPLPPHHICVPCGEKTTGSFSHSPSQELMLLPH